MALRGPTLREVRALLDENGPAAWSELTRRYGPSFRYRSAVATSDPELRRQEVHVGGDPRLTRFMIPRFAAPLPFTVAPVP